MRYSKPLLKVWLAWSIISLLMPFNLGKVMEVGYLAEREGYWGFLMSTPLNSLFEGGLVHLWFIPALICAVAILAATHRNEANQSDFAFGAGVIPVWGFSRVVTHL